MSLSLAALVVSLESTEILKIDLHIHTTTSDGGLSPRAVAEAAAAGGLDVIAVTDHDTTAGFAEAAAVGHDLSVHVLPAIEVSSTQDGREVHVLGYCVDPSFPGLVAHERAARRRRDERMREMLERLAAQGIELTFEAVESAAGPDHVAIGRPHLARAMVAAGHVRSVNEAFDTLIGDRGPAFVSLHALTALEAVELIRAAHGIAVWAHPPADLVDGLVGPMIAAGLQGLEVYRPRQRRDLLLRYEGVCRASGLFPTGGSDWHGPEGGAALGDFYVTGQEAAAFLEAGGL